MRISDCSSDVCSSDRAEKDMVHAADTREAARGDLIDHGDRDRQAKPDVSRIILTHTNAEVRELNEAARERMHATGELGRDVAIKTERGDRMFASGDRIMFLRNERSIEVQNGTRATIERVSEQRMSSEERRVGKEGVSTCRSRGSPDH